MSKRKSNKRIKTLDLFFSSADGEHCVNARGLHERIGAKDKFTAWWRRSILPFAHLTETLDYLVELPLGTKSKHPYCATYRLTPQAAIAALHRELTTNRRDVEHLLDACRGRRSIVKARELLAKKDNDRLFDLKTPTEEKNSSCLGCRCGDLLVVGYKDPAMGESVLTVRESPVPGYCAQMDGMLIANWPEDGGVLANALGVMPNTIRHAGAAWAAGSDKDLATLLPEYEFHLEKGKPKEDKELQAAFGRIAETIENGIKEKEAAVEEKKAEVEPIGSTSAEEPDNGMYRFAPDPGDDQFDGIGERGRALAVDWYWMGWTKSGQQLREAELAECEKEHPALHTVATIAFKRLRNALDPLPAVKSLELLRKFAETIHDLLSDDFGTRSDARLRFTALRYGLYQPEAEVLPIGSTSAEEPAPRTWNESPAFSSLDDGEPYPDPTEPVPEFLGQDDVLSDELLEEALEAGRKWVNSSGFSLAEPTFAQTVGAIMRSEPPETEDAEEELGSGDTMTIYEPLPGDSLLAPDFAIRHDEPKRGVWAWVKERLFGHGSAGKVVHTRDYGGAGKVVPTMPPPPAKAWMPSARRSEQMRRAIATQIATSCRDLPAEVESGASEWSKLLPVIPKDGKAWLDARLLHAQMESGRDFSTWVKYQIKSHQYAEGEDFVVCSPTVVRKGRGGHNSIEYLLTAEAAQEIAVSSYTPKGRAIRRYLIDCEHRLRTGQPRVELFGYPLIRPKLTHVSQQPERIAGMKRLSKTLRDASQEVTEIHKSLEESEKLRQFNLENPVLPGIEDAELKAAKEHITELETTMAALEAERDQLKEWVAELEKQSAAPSIRQTCERNDLARELQDAKARIKELEAENAELLEEFAKTTTKAANLATALEAAKVAVKESNATMQSALTRIKELEAQVSELKDTLALAKMGSDELLEMGESQLMVPGGLVNKVAAADIRIRQLEWEKTELEEKLTATQAQMSQMSRPLQPIIDEAAIRESLEDELTIMKRTADKLTEHLAERDRLFDQQQKELAEAKLETQRVLALLQAPEKDITLTDFFKETESVLGYSDTAGIEYLTRKGAEVLYRKKDAVGKEYLWANNAYGCYFHHVRSFYDHPITVDGVRTDKFLSVKTYTAKLIPDVKGSDGGIVKIGGYTWLKERMMKDELTTLHRLIAETGGATGEFSRFDGYVLSKAKDDTLPGLMSVGEKVILFAKGTGDVAGIRKDEWVAGCRTKDGAERATGLTLRDALRNLRDKLVG